MSPVKGGIIIGAAVLINYLFFDPLGMCVGCYLGNTLSWVEHSITEHALLLPRIPPVVQMPIIGMFLGAFLAAWLAKEFWIRKVKLGPVLISFLAGILIGFGNFLASGCPTRHIIVGVPAFALDSWAAAFGIIVGIFIGVQILKWWAQRNV